LKEKFCDKQNITTGWKRKEWSLGPRRWLVRYCSQRPMCCITTTAASSQCLSYRSTS